MAFIREAFTTSQRDSSITDAHLNSGYAAQIAGNGDPANGVPSVKLPNAGLSTAVYGEIMGALNAETVTIKTGGIARFRTNQDIAEIELALQTNQGVHIAEDGLVESSRAPNEGKGLVIGYETESGQTYIIADLDAN